MRRRGRDRRGETCVQRNRALTAAGGASSIGRMILAAAMYAHVRKFRTMPGLATRFMR